jgi:phage terminase small subunit
MISTCTGASARVVGVFRIPTARLLEGFVAEGFRLDPRIVRFADISCKWVFRIRVWKGLPPIVHNAAIESTGRSHEERSPLHEGATMGTRGPRKARRPGEAPRVAGGGGRPEKPAHVEEDPVASKAFNDAVEALEGMRILRRSHEMPLALFATEWSRHVAAARIARTAPIVDGPRGPKANPAAGVASQAARVALDLLRDFGLTPSALARVDVPEEADPSISLVDEYRRRRDRPSEGDDEESFEGLTVAEIIRRRSK